jgi:hypothetical protein
MGRNSSAGVKIQLVKERKVCSQNMYKQVQCMMSMSTKEVQWSTEYITRVLESSKVLFWLASY